MVNPRDIAGNVEEEEEEKISAQIINPRDIAGNAEEEEEKSHTKW